MLNTNTKSGEINAIIKYSGVERVRESHRSVKKTEYFPGVALRGEQLFQQIQPQRIREVGDGCRLKSIFVVRESSSS